MSNLEPRLIELDCNSSRGGYFLFCLTYGHPKIELVEDGVNEPQKTDPNTKIIIA